MTWYFVNTFFLNCYWNLSSGFKVVLLKIFGAHVGKGVLKKPKVNIKRLWRLCISDDVWIGEGVWIDNNTDVIIESKVVISQDAILLCGNHKKHLTQCQARLY